MPKFRFDCTCGTVKDALCTPERAKKGYTCSTCGNPMTRQVQGASSKVVEILEKAGMTRRIERPADAERLFKERSKFVPDREP